MQRHARCTHVQVPKLHWTEWDNIFLLGGGGLDPAPPATDPAAIFQNLGGGGGAGGVRIQGPGPAAPPGPQHRFHGHRRVLSSCVGALWAGAGGGGRGRHGFPTCSPHTQGGPPQCEIECSLVSLDPPRKNAQNWTENSRLSARDKMPPANRTPPPSPPPPCISYAEVPN